ncbi:MFS transporter [Pseudaquabacterium pictum]|uniref:MFS transporter n=1 Tax=Pseudaquabacterium pictum TaxID=2315236 RepID=A0A480B1C6_9BURK|nr:MFS transporter [Rubrivivax pictus]GCL66157.1 MFS transporter [Rubrivivax pictus]
MPATPPPPAQQHTSIWVTLRHRSFRTLWIASAVYFVANAMHGMAASWLMVELTGSSFLAALVQTAVFLPMFVLALPAGVLADTTDRGRLILAALAVQAVSVVVLAGLMLAGWGGPATLLLFTFLSGCCTAMLSPAWNSAVGEILPRDELPQAITAMSIAYNGARALGPALAGLVYGLASGLGGSGMGGGAVFVLALAGIGVLAHDFHRRPPKPHPPTKLPPERLWGGTLAGLRYAWHAETILAQLVRTAAYSAAGSALWALLPVIGQQRLGLGAEGFGGLMACLGTGAVAAGLTIGPLRQRLGLERLIAICCVVFAAVMAVAALSRWALPVYLALVAGGGAWMAVMNTFNTATQTSAPPWVRSRATAMHVLSALGPFALGSALWGAVAGLLGLQTALVLATALMLANLLLARRFPLRMGAPHEVTPAPFTDLLVADEPDPAAGPVAVELSYRIDAAQAETFLALAIQLKGPRQRDGATFWRIYRDLDDAGRFVERFIVTSWADYLHQRARQTVADQAIEAQLRELLLPGEQVVMQHYIAER